MSDPLLPSDYQDFLGSIIESVQQSRLNAVIAVNRELIMLYWHIGREILQRQQKEGWGAKVIDTLSKDLHAEFPQMRGFSSRNLKYMRAFAEAYPEKQFVQTVSARITWSHNTLLLDKVKDADERFWYMQQAAVHGWSHSILAIQIETNLYHRQGKALNDFKTALPALDSDLAKDVLKDPYIFDFITTNDETKERNIQHALLAHIRRFLLELGTGFTFVGSDYHLDVGDQDFYIDLLFYHTRLRCYIVIELKAGSFKPEYAGKLSFYMTAVDEQLKYPDDNPTIGLILCKTNDNKSVAEYALKNIQSPIGIATYQSSSALPEPFKDQLPSVQELEEQLQDIQPGVAD